MANGDITHVKELGRSVLPGGGTTTGGVNKNDKVMVWGEMSAVYVSTGIAVNLKGGPRAFGLETLDYAQFEVRSADVNVPATTVLLSANYLHTTDKIFVSEDDAEGTAPSDADVILLRYLCIGSSASAPDQV